VSVSSQADTERADLERERLELANDGEFEHEELTAIYQGRGLERGLAERVATQLMEHDALGAHARDELGLTETHTARPIQAAVTSAASFAVGAGLPMTAAVASPAELLVPVVAGTSLCFLALLGGLAARAGGANAARGAARVTFWGALAMLLTAIVGRVFDVVA